MANPVRTAIAVVCISWCTTIAASARAQVETDEPPVAGRPDDFSDLVGFYQIRSTAAPATLRVEDPLLLTVRIAGTGPEAYQPQRRRLHLFPPAFSDDFYVEPLPDKDRFLAQEKAWEFCYHLRPKRQAVKQVPSLKLVYYSPARRRFQSTYSEPIPLQISARPIAETPAGAVKGGEPPARFYELATGPRVLRRNGPAALSLPVFLLAALLPPGLCAMWYARWRSRHSNKVAQRRSRAAQLALNLLQQENAAQPDRTFEIFTDYLRQRLDLEAAGPTGFEVGKCLRRIGASKAILRQVALFCEACDAARFAPAPAGTAQLPAAAGDLIQALESKRCFSEVGPVTRPRRRFMRAGVLTVAGIALIALRGTTAAQEDSKTVGQSETVLLERAETEFLRGIQEQGRPAEARQAFARAASHYEALHRRGIDNPFLLGNLGNAEFLAGRLARAIRAYGRGLRLAPNDAALRANLEYARTRIRYPPGTRPSEPAWPAFLPRLTLEILQALTLILFSAAGVFWTRRIMTGRGTIPTLLSSAGAVLAVTGLALTYWQFHEDERHPLVVVVADGTTVYRGNGESYPPHPLLPSVNEGMEARRLVERGDWVQIQFLRGEIGWVKKNAVFAHEIIVERLPATRPAAAARTGKNRSGGRFVAADAFSRRQASPGRDASSRILGPASPGPIPLRLLAECRFGRDTREVECGGSSRLLLDGDRCAAR